MVSSFNNARSCLSSLMNYGTRISSSWPPLVQYIIAHEQCFPPKCSFYGRTPKTIFLIPRNPHPPVKTKTKWTSIWRRKQINPVLSPLLGFYAAQIGSLSQTFWHNLSVPSTKIKLSITWVVKLGPIGCPETSLTNHHSTPHNITEDRRSHSRHGGSFKSRILQYHQLPVKKKKRDISRDIWNFSRHFEIFIHSFHDFLRNPVWKRVP